MGAASPLSIAFFVQPVKPFRLHEQLLLPFGL
jgi:hypothetical protein